MMLSYKNKPELSEFIQKYKSAHPLLLKMSDTQQDTTWHQEGDVEVHVSMVLSEMYALIEGEYSYLSDSDKQVLVFAAVYHDYAKPVTARIDYRGERECIVFPRHEQVGASLLLFSERPEELSSDEWLMVIKLIANHQMPKRAISNDYSRGSLLRLLLDSGSLKLLHVLSMADFRGRIAADMDIHVETLELFLMEAEYQDLLLPADSYTTQLRDELNLSGVVGAGRYSTELDGGNDAIFEQILTSMLTGKVLSPSEGLSLPFNFESKSTVIVMCGLSGSGKSSLVVNLAIDHKAEVISLDLIREELCRDRSSQDLNGRVRREAQERLKECLRADRNVVWDATSLREDFRTAVTSTARAYGAYTKIVCLTTPVTECVRRDSLRLHSVGEVVIREQHDKFQLPSRKEADSIEFV